MRAPIEKNAAGLQHSRDWMGSNADLYRPELWQAARDIAVNNFRQIYIWPLTLRLAGLPAKDDNVDQESLVDTAIDAAEAAIRRETTLWEEITDLLDHATRPGPASIVDDVHRYGEFVYFHDFLQSILFRDTTAKPAFRIYRHKLITMAEITVGSRLFRARVERCNLYLFRSGAATLAIELVVDAPEPVEEEGKTRGLKLADVEDFVDCARRSYTPYHWTDDDGRLQPGQVVKRFGWLTKDGAFSPASAPNTLAADLEQIKKRDSANLRSAPMAQHWLDILKPLRVAGYDQDVKLSVRNPVWRHVVDERISAMSYISLTGAAKTLGAVGKTPAIEGQPELVPALNDLWLVSRGDWIRLAYADKSGTDALPYAHQFLHRFEDDACYDRYFGSDASTSASRYMFTGYHFAAVGASGPGDNFFDATILHHFRRHYFQMGLILNMEFASLLATSSRISEAVRRLKLDSNEAAFRATFLAIQRDFLQFVHQFHFTGLSNQLQAREMFSRWRQALGVEGLFQDVKNEIESATSFLLADEQVEQGKAANNLATIAAIGVMFGLAFSFLGMNVLVGETTIKELLEPKAGSWTSATKQLLPFGVVLVITSLAWRALVVRLAPDVVVEGLTSRILMGTVVAGVVFIVAGLMGLLCAS